MNQACCLRSGCAHCRLVAKPSRQAHKKGVFDRVFDATGGGDGRSGDGDRVSTGAGREEEAAQPCQAGHQAGDHPDTTQVNFNCASIPARAGSFCYTALCYLLWYLHYVARDNEGIRANSMGVVLHRTHVIAAWKAAGRLRPQPRLCGLLCAFRITLFGS